MQIEPKTTSANIIAGTHSIVMNAVGAAIGGGGASGWPNLVTDNFGHIGGGQGNQAGDGGMATDAVNATVGGGYSNKATGGEATVGGGYTNEASGDTSTIGGGSTNEASGQHSTVAGGSNNTSALERRSGGRPAKPPALMLP